MIDKQKMIFIYNTKPKNIKLMNNFWKIMKYFDETIKTESFRNIPPESSTLQNKFYGHLPPIIQTMWVRQTRQAVPCWRNKEFLLWTLTYGHTSVSQPAKTYIHRPCADMRCRSEDLPRIMADNEWWRERERERILCCPHLMMMMKRRRRMKRRSHSIEEGSRDTNK